MSFLETSFWLLMIMLSFPRSPREIRDLAREHPEFGLEHSYLRRSMFWWRSLPWFFMGAGILSGATPGLRDYLRPQDLNPFVLAFLGSLVVTRVVASYWVFHGGAEKLARHRLVAVFYLNGGNALSADQIKALLVGGACMVVIAFVFLFAQDLVPRT